MECRAGCGACCTAPSISSPIPGMPHGKPAGVRCVQLSDDNLCLLFGSTRDEALVYLSFLERATAPLPPTPPGSAATVGGSPRTAPGPAR